MAFSRLRLCRTGVPQTDHKEFPCLLHLEEKIPLIFCISDRLSCIIQQVGKNRRHVNILQKRKIRRPDLNVESCSLHLLHIQLLIENQVQHPVICICDPLQASQHPANILAVSVRRFQIS